MIYLLWLLASGAARVQATYGSMTPPSPPPYNPTTDLTPEEPRPGDWTVCAQEHAPGGNVCDATEGGACYFENYTTDITFGQGDHYTTLYNLDNVAVPCQHLGDCDVEPLVFGRRLSDKCEAGLCCANDNPPAIFDVDPAPGVRKWCKCRRGYLTTTGGDPITTFQGQTTRYWLSMEHFTPVFEQGPIVLSQLAGPANPPPGLENHKGAWVMAMEVDVGGVDKIVVETVDPTTLLAQPNATATPVAGALTTMRLSFVGKQLKAGEHKLSVSDMTIAVSAKADPDQKIGRGFVEKIDIKAEGLHLRITSSKANKFADETLQVLGLHLDVEFLTFEQDMVRGALPEMWGLQPMSKETKLLLEKPAGF